MSRLKRQLTKKADKSEIIGAVDKLRKAFYDVEMAMAYDEENLLDTYVDKYPFQESFDVVYTRVNEWYDDLRKNIQ
jgi:hypothetical protein